MSTQLPESCFVRVSLEITPAIVRSFPEKVNLLYQAQLAARSVTALESGLGLLLELARELVPCDSAAAAWRQDVGQPFRVRASRDLGAARLEALRSIVEGLPVERAMPIILARSELQGRIQAAMGELAAESILAVPFGSTGAPPGLVLLMRRTGKRFAPSEAQMIRLLCLGFEPILDEMAGEDGTPRPEFLDRLTGLFNRRYFEQELEREIARAKRAREPVSILLLDLDDLDRVRLERGPAVADAMFQAIVRRVSATCRCSDTLARCGTNRLGIILPRTGRGPVAVLARRLFSALSTPVLEDLLGGKGIVPRVCMGVASLPEHGDTCSALLRQAEEAVEKARQLDGVRYWDPPVEGTLYEDRLLDPTRVVLLREKGQDPASLLPVIARLCREAVPADRISIMLKADGHLIIQEALGFEGRDQVIRTTRIPLSSKTVSGWVARSRKPLVVPGEVDISQLPVNRIGGYRADSFLSYPVVWEGELLGVIHFSNRSDGEVFTREDLDRFRPVGELIARYLAANRHFARSRQEFLRESLYALVDLVERMVPGKEGHSKRVSELAAAMAARLGTPPEQVERIRVSARLHDLGKAGYRIQRLSAPRRWGEAERRETAMHPLLGWQFAEALGLEGLDRDAVLYHHEREDGSGYMGRKGEAIPLSAKIVGVADVYAALTEPRPYRSALPPDKALEVLERNERERFDPRVVAALREVVSGSAG